MQERCRSYLHSHSINMNINSQLVKMSTKQCMRHSTGNTYWTYVPRLCFHASSHLGILCSSCALPSAWISPPSRYPATSTQRHQHHTDLCCNLVSPVDTTTQWMFRTLVVRFCGQRHYLIQPCQAGQYGSYDSLIGLTLAGFKCHKGVELPCNGPCCLVLVLLLLLPHHHHHLIC